MTKFSLIRVFVGFLLLAGGLLLTFRQRLTYEKENVGDLLAVVGLILMVMGLVVLATPFLGRP